MNHKRPSPKHTPKNPRIKPAMPATTLAPLSGRRRLKPIKARVLAALALDPDLYRSALKRAELKHDNNFSSYVRSLLKRDLGIAA